MTFNSPPEPPLLPSSEGSGVGTAMSGRVGDGVLTLSIRFVGTGVGCEVSVGAGLGIGEAGRRVGDGDGCVVGVGVGIGATRMRDAQTDNTITHRITRA